MTQVEAGPPPSRTRRSVSLAIRTSGRPGQLLTVRRPDDDPDLPGAWGLPAASLRAHESWESAARRAARDKIGVDVRLGRELNRGEIIRGDTRFIMRLFDARLVAGEPQVPQLVTGVTQYTDWRWDNPAALEPAARRGSLCCRLALELPPA